MNEKYKYRFKYILKITLWFFAGGALFVLLLSAMHRNKRLHCTGVDISIEGYNHEVFISNAEVKEMLEKESVEPLMFSSQITQQYKVKTVQQTIIVSIILKD